MSYCALLVPYILEATYENIFHRTSNVTHIKGD